MRRAFLGNWSPQALGLQANQQQASGLPVWQQARVKQFQAGLQAWQSQLDQYRNNLTHLNQRLNNLVAPSAQNSPYTLDAVSTTSTPVSGSPVSGSTAVTTPIPTSSSGVSFSANGQSAIAYIFTGDTATLSWNVPFPATVSLSGGTSGQPGYVNAGPLAASSSMPVSPSSTQTYTLTVVDSTGAATDYFLAVLVTSVSFGANPPSITPGAQTTLSWNVANGSAIALDYQTPMSFLPLPTTSATSGTQIVLPTATQTYNLQILSPNGNTRNFPITVNVTGSSQSPSPTGAPIVQTPNGPQSVTTNNYIITGTSAAGSKVTVWQATSSGQKTTPPTPLYSETLLSGATYFSIPVNLIAGLNYFVVSSFDSLGNESPTAVVPPITLNSAPSTLNSAPFTPIITAPPPTPPTQTTATSYTIMGTIPSTGPSGAIPQVWQAANGQIIPNTPVISSPAVSGANASFSISVPLVPGANNFIVTTTDVATQTQSVPVIVPTITQIANTPAVIITTPTASPPAQTSVTPYTITGTVPTTGANGTLIKISQAVNGQMVPNTNPVATESLYSGNTGFALSVPLVTGANNFIVTATDIATQAQSVPVPVPPITLLPSFSSLSWQPGAGNVAQVTCSNVSGIGSQGGWVQVWQGSGTQKSWPNQSVVFEQLPPGSATFTISVPVVSGVNNFVVTVFDNAANVESNPVPLQISSWSHQSQQAQMMFLPRHLLHTIFELLEDDPTAFREDRYPYAKRVNAHLPEGYQPLTPAMIRSHFDHWHGRTQDMTREHEERVDERSEYTEEREEDVLLERRESKLPVNDEVLLRIFESLDEAHMTADRKHPMVEHINRRLRETGYRPASQSQVRRAWERRLQEQMARGEEREEQ